MANANVKAVITAEDRASSTISGVGASFGKLSAAMAAGNLAADAISAGLRKVVEVGKLSIGMAFDQVRSVENATFALRAYEKDGNKVNAVLKDLVAYARSDMGVLFQRDELFKAASNLRGFGESADTVVDRVKTLSKGVALGMTTFDELSQIIGRATQQGKVSAEIYDMLAQRGIILDSSFRGAAKSSEQLYTELNRVLPDSLLEGRAKTIDGLFIRLKSSLRDLGASFLGVDKETSKFIEGGLGDRFLKAVSNFRDLLASPAVKNAISGLSSSLIEFGERAADVIPRIVEVAKSVVKHLQPGLSDLGDKVKDLFPLFAEFIKQYLVPLSRAVGFTLVAAIKTFISALNFIAGALRPVIRWLNNNRNTVIDLTSAIVVLYATIKAVSAFNAMNTALAVLRMGFVAQTIATVGLSGSIGVLGTAIKAFMLSIGPLGWIITAVSVAAGVLGSQWAKGALEADRQKAAQDRLTEATNKLKDAQQLLKDANLNVEGANLRVETAQRNLNDAIALYGPNSLEARQATYDLKVARNELETANKNAAEKQQDLTTAEGEYADAERKKKVIDAMNEIAGAAWGISDAAKSATKNLTDALNVKAPADVPRALKGQTAPNQDFLNFLGGGRRASGGPVMKNTPYVVGERGREVFVPSQSGQIVPNNKIANTGGGSTIVNVSVNAGAFMGSQQDARRYAQQIADALKDIAKMNGTTVGSMLS